VIFSPASALLLLSTLAVGSGAAAIRAFAAFRRLRLLAAREDLTEARRAARRGAFNLCMFTASMLALLALGRVWTDDWRASVVGVGTLNILLGLAVALGLWAFRRVLHHQWSASGSTSGLVVWTLACICCLGLTMLIASWRLG
jgi:hypothetical protein